METASPLERLRQKLNESQRKEIQKIQEIEETKLLILSESLRNLLKKELATITKDTHALAIRSMKELQEIEGTIRVLKKRKILQSWIVGIAIILGLAAGAWGIGRYTSSKLELLAKIETSFEDVKRYRAIQQLFADGIELKKGWYAKLGKSKKGRVFIEIIEEE